MSITDAMGVAGAVLFVGTFLFSAPRPKDDSQIVTYCLSSDCKKHNGGKASCPMESGR